MRDFNRNSQGGAKIVLILLSLALIGGGIFGFGHTKLLKQKAEAVIGQQLQSIATSDWKIYHDDEFGFEVKYPKEWAITTKEETINIEEGTKKIFSVFSGGLSFNIFMASDNEKNMRLLEDLRKTPIGNVVEINYTAYSVQGHSNVSGLTAVMYYADRYQSLLNQSLLIFPSIMGEAMLKKGETIFHFMLIVEQEALLEENKDIFKQILSTFRFTK